MLGPETHTINAGKGRDPLLQVQCQWLETAPWFSRALAPVYRSVFSSPDPTHIHPTSVPCPLPCTPATVSYSQSQDEPHCLLRSSLCLENSPSFYLAFTRFPQSPWPETLMYPSSLNLDVDFCRNPSLFPRHGCLASLKAPFTVLQSICLFTYWSLSLDDHFQQIKMHVYHRVPVGQGRSLIQIHRSDVNERGVTTKLVVVGLFWSPQVRSNPAGPAPLCSMEEGFPNQARGPFSSSRAVHQGEFPSKLSIGERPHLRGQLTHSRKASAGSQRLSEPYQ